MAVKGKVTYLGIPVAWGSIALRPAPGAKGPAAGTDIVDGKFEIPASAGPAAGSYTARITIVERNEAAPKSQKLARGAGKVESLEVPVDIRADREVYDLELPVSTK